ncbi:hypothetical protein [Sphingobacterium chuzhouense]|uniref:hypothetical protein n=1 Tax=Sphingobacterium chuzhouense TaxID=1742264 RepID=UPI0036D405B3
MGCLFLIWICFSRINAQPTTDETLHFLDTVKTKIYSEEEKVAGIKRIYKGKFNTWEEQLKFAKIDGGNERYLHKNSLYLLYYTVTTEKKPLIASDSIIVIAHGNNTLSILPVHVDKVEALSQENRKKQIIELFQELDSNLFEVKLKWEHNGNRFETDCIVSERFNCIVYDPILSNAFIFRDENTSAAAHIYHDKSENNKRDSSVKDLAEKISKVRERGKLSLVEEQTGGFESWEEQLDFIRQGGYKGVLNSSDLSLVSYKLVDEKQTPNLEEFKKMPVTIISVNDQRKIPIIMKIPEKSKLSIYYNTRKRTMIDYYDELDANLRLVKLVWKYQETEFHTYCVVSEIKNTIIYDDILSNAFVTESTITSSAREYDSVLTSP